MTLPLVGEQYGRLVVVAELPRARRYVRRFLCRCACGNTTEANFGNLRSGRIQSCGCLRSEVAATRATTHGQYGSATWITWGNMIQRCTNKKHKDYKNYGGRGVTVDPRWRAFEVFFEDMGPRPPGHTLERKKNELGYSKTNCEWATRLQQGSNQRTNRRLTFEGRTQTLAQWSRERGLNAVTILSRLDKYGWPVERALSTPVRT
jgi:hypothetical protein